MRVDTARSHLKDGQRCMVSTKNGEFEVRWSSASWCFFYLDRGTPIVCNDGEIEEWWPILATT
jgi:hypothetical protein